jgi:hypothetical protein
MNDLVRATETFACEHGLYHWHGEYPADDPAVKQFPQFFEPIVVGEQAAPKRPARRAAKADG